MQTIQDAKILVVDDNRELRNLIKEELTGAGYRAVRMADSAAAARQAISGELPELVILDINLPDGDGFSLFREIRGRSDIPILFLSARDADGDRLFGLGLGADDYMTKPFNPLELTARVKSQLRRYTQLGSTVEKENQAVYTVGGLMIDDDQKEITVDGEPVKLTPIEYNILLLLVKNQGKVFSIDQIYESIWNEDAIGVDNTVAVHIRHIREKIEINPKEPRYLKVVWGVGYKIEKL